MNEITYCKKNDEIECIRYKNWTKSYPPHTHTTHLTVGYVEEGKLCIVFDGKEKIYGPGDEFQILPNIVHELKPASKDGYSMVVTCIKIKSQDKESSSSISEANLSALRDSILDRPENLYLIEEMARDSNISPFYMIRQFKKAFGLTPHQFQIQCKVRKAQKLLEEEKDISEVTYESGFCDQSHLNRCFHKIVGLTPKDYQKSIEEEN